MAQPVKIADHCMRLTRRYIDQAAGRSLDQQELHDAFDSACRSVWGLTLSDVNLDLIPAEEQQWASEAEGDALYEYAFARGYDIDAYIQGDLVPHTDEFVLMIKAEEHGAFARTPEERAALKLKQEAAKFVADRAKGIIHGGY
jgi:hypothetical protein